MLLFKLERHFGSQRYIEIMYKTLLILGYYGLLRVREMMSSPHCLKAKDVHVGQNKDKLLLVLHSSKTHSKNKAPQQIKIVGVAQAKTRAEA